MSIYFWGKAYFCHLNRWFLKLYYQILNSSSSNFFLMQSRNCQSSNSLQIQNLTQSRNKFPQTSSTADVGQRSTTRSAASVARCVLRALFASCKFYIKNLHVFPILLKPIENDILSYLHPKSKNDSKCRFYHCMAIKRTKLSYKKYTFISNAGFCHFCSETYKKKPKRIKQKKYIQFVFNITS